MREVTVICMEDHKGYPDPLIYNLEVENLDYDHIFEMVVRSRVLELGEEFEAEIRDELRVILVFEGDLTPICDWRE